MSLVDDTSTRDKPMLNRVLTIIRERRDDIERQYGIRLTGVVGSVARGEETSVSDVDITYEIIGSPDLFDIIHAEDDLEKSFGRPVDLVDLSALRKLRREYVSRDLVSL